MMTYTRRGNAPAVTTKFSLYKGFVWERLRMVEGEIAEVNSVFEQPWWLDTVAPGRWREFRIQNANGECVARFPYVEKKYYGINIIGTPDCTQHLGPWFKIESNSNRVGLLKTQKKYLEQFEEYLRQFSNVNLAFSSEFKYLYPFIWAGYRVQPAYTYVIDDLKNLNTVFMGMDSTTRNEIRKAEKITKVVYDVDCDTLIALVGNTYRKQGRKLPNGRESIERIYKAAYTHQAGKAIGIEYDSKIVAVGFFLYDKHRCYYIYGGKDFNVKVKGLQERVLWEGIKFASTVSEVFDFEGSMIKGIEQFFRGFGGEPKVYFSVKRGG